MKRNKPVILVADDSVEILIQSYELFKDECKILMAKNVDSFWEILSKQTPDLVLLDVNFGEVSGLDVLNEFNQKYDKDIPVIIITSPNENIELESLQRGAVDFYSKPFNLQTFKAHVLTHCEKSLQRKKEKIETINLINENALKTAQIDAIKEATIMALVNIACVRDNETGNHLLRTQAYVRMIAKQLVQDKKVNLTEAQIDLIARSAPLHDIGKVGIPDKILLKPGKLTTDEFEIMKTHTTLGYQALKATGLSNDAGDFLAIAQEIAYSHHEKWDGSGYPRGLKGAEIPLSARIMACADAYDALISVRPYKRPFSHEQAIQLILDGRGYHFDPDVVDAFIKNENQAKKIAMQFCDPLDNNYNDIEERR